MPICKTTGAGIFEYIADKSSLEQKVCRNHGEEELSKNDLQQLVCYSIFINVEINKFTNVSCTDCFSEAVKMQEGACLREKAV